MKISPYELLDRRREGEPWSDGELESFIKAWLNGGVADYQVAAFLMAVAIRGMSGPETAALTRVMTDSGENWALRDRFEFLADKHSTGGVGDKVSIALAPWLASCGIRVAMLSGRGLGHTGGTLDKLESIPGFRAGLSLSEIITCVEDVGCAIATSTEAIAPADRKMYALRDVTGTVRSIPLITASIMSKKLAMGASALLLDVKAGRGAFMRELDEARRLAESLIRAAEGSGTTVSAIVTDMSAPIGRTIGNSLEVQECVDLLRGSGPSDLYELTRYQAARLITMSGNAGFDEACRLLDRAVEDGSAIAAMRDWVAAQGGDSSFIDEPGRLPSAPVVANVQAPTGGFVSAIDPLTLGYLGVEIGAGRFRQDDSIDHGAGVRILRHIGEAVERGDLVAEIMTNADVDIESVAGRAAEAWSYDVSAPAPRTMILGLES